MGKTWAAVALAVLICWGCGKAKPTAADVCKALVEAKIAENCRGEAPGGIGSAAKERSVFDLPAVPGQTGQVLTFDKAEFFQSTEKAFAAAAALAGKHQYGNSDALVFVQLNSETPDEVGQQAKTVVEGL